MIKDTKNVKNKMQPVDERGLRRFRVRWWARAFNASFIAIVLAMLGIHALDGSHAGRWQDAVIGFISSGVPVPAQPFTLPRNYAVDEKALECLAIALRYEAWGEGDEGQIAVAIATQNRVVREWRGAKHDCEAIFDPMQFSFANAYTATHDVNSSAKLALDMVTTASVSSMDETIAWGVSQVLAEYVLRNEPEVQVVRAKLDGADHYLTQEAYDAAGKNHWSRHEDMVFITKIGEHRFYRWDG